jgi:hypothetical protein
VLIYTGSGWPLWARALVAIFAAGLFLLMAWRYYQHYLRR